MPVGQQLVAIEGETWPPLIRLVQVHAVVPGNNELGVLGRIGQRGAAQGAAVGVQLHPGILLNGQSVALRERSRRVRLGWINWQKRCRASHTYKDFLQSRHKQVRHFGHLAEGQARDGAAALVQGQRFTVAVSGDVPFGQNHAAVREACPQTTLAAEAASCERVTDGEGLTNSHEVQVLMDTKAGHLCWFVTGNCREDPGAQRVPAVSLVQVPDLHLERKNRCSQLIYGEPLSFSRSRF